MGGGLGVGEARMTCRRVDAVNNFRVRDPLVNCLFSERSDQFSNDLRF